MAGKRGRPSTRRARWGTVRHQRSGNVSASYRHGGIPGVVPSIEYFAPTTFETEADARVWLAMERRLIDSGQWTPPADRLLAQRRAEEAAGRQLTVGEYAAGWLEHADLRPTSRARYRQLLRYYVLAEAVPSKAKGKPGQPLTAVGLGEVPLAELSRADVVTWWRALPLKTRRPSCDQAYAMLRTILNDAVSEELLDRSPCHVKGAGKASAHRSIDPLTPAQVWQIAEAMPDRWALGVLLGAWTALRVGEVRELRRRDIDLQAGTISISRAVSSGLADLVVGEPKTAAGRRVVAVPAPLQGALRAHLRDHTQIGPNGLLFWDERSGEQVTYHRWDAAFHRACEAAGIEGVRFHDLRHTGLTYAATAGATIRELQQMAGHTSSAMAMRYQSVAAGHMAGVVGQLGTIIELGRPADE